MYSFHTLLVRVSILPRLHSARSYPVLHSTCCGCGKMVRSDGIGGVALCASSLLCLVSRAINSTHFGSPLRPPLFSVLQQPCMDACSRYTQWFYASSDVASTRQSTVPHNLDAASGINHSRTVIALERPNTTHQSGGVDVVRAIIGLQPWAYASSSYSLVENLRGQF